MATDNASSIYVVDSSALIDLRVLYPRDTFPGVWDRLEALIREGRLIAPDEVLHELEKRDDELLAWVKANRQMFQGTDQLLIDEAAAVLVDFPELVNVKRPGSQGDPFVVALARIESGNQANLFGAEVLVVTQERKTVAKMKIPDACKSYQIPCITLKEMFQREGWQFA